MSAGVRLASATGQGLYPALHLRRLGFQTEIRREVSDDDLAGASAVVVITDGALTACERQLVCFAAARGLPVVFCPQDGIAEADRDFVRSSGVVAWQTEPSMLPRIPTVRCHGGGCGTDLQRVRD